MDVVRLHQAGITYAVATLGTATTQEHLQQNLPADQRAGVLLRRRPRGPARRRGARSRTRCRWRATGASSNSCFCRKDMIPTRWWRRKGAEALRGRASKSALPLSEYLVQQLLQQVDMAPRGRPRQARRAGRAPVCAHAARAFIGTCSLDRLAAEIRMPAAKLQRALTPAGRPLRGEPAPRHGEPGAGTRAEPNRPSRSRMSAGRGNLLSQAISLVLHHPAAARAVARARRSRASTCPASACSTNCSIRRPR